MRAPSPPCLTDGGFTLLRPAQSLAFTGERMTTEREGQVEFEHFHRYCIARDICIGRDVLDVASGEGYGAAMLAGVARRVSGLEIDAVSVVHARAGYALANLEFVQGDAQAMPFADGSFDVVVSFETLEHLRDQKQFLREVKRVLRPDGLLLVSTPDRQVYSGPGQPVNPYHVLELSHSEFSDVLTEFFVHHSILQQRTLLGSVIASSAPSGWRSYDRRAPDRIEASSGLACAFYLIGVASDAMLPEVSESIYGDNRSVDDLIAASVALPVLRADLQSQQAHLTATETEQSARLAATEAQLEQHRRRAEHAERSAVAVRERLAAIESSTVWRVTSPLRQAVARFPWLARGLRRAVRLAWWTVTMQLPRRYAQWREGRSVGASTLPPRPKLAPSPPPHPGEIVVPSSATPVVSIIISTYGQLDLTLRCLKSIADHAPDTPIEVIVVDDAYPGTEDMGALREIAGIRYVRNAANLGFLLSCNQAARSATGRYIYMLNNDTELMPGAIDALVALLDARPDAGLAGSRLLYPDGRLQEAGGIVWNDASVWNYGRGEDPSQPQFNYVREVDYCSGASILVRRAVFEALGGFDEAFVPAYYEDVDLAFRIRAQGLKVLYEPRSVVIHHEGMSHGTDTKVGPKAHQVVNETRMRERWGATLTRDGYRNGEHVLRARDRARHRKVILVIDHYVPEPDRDAGSRSVMGIIDAVLDAGWVVKFWPHNRVYTAAYTEMLERRGVEVLDCRWPGDLGAWMRAHGMDLDHLLVIRPTVATEILPDLVWNTDAVLSFYGVDLHCARMRRQAAQDGNAALAAEADAMERLERRVWRHFDVVIYPSEEEAAVVRAMAPTAFVRGIVPFCFDRFPDRTAPPNERGILFVAGFAHAPNVDAAEFLITEIVPRLKREIGPVSVVLAGSNPSDAVRALAGKDIEVTGYLTDDELAALYQRQRVAVVPLRYGAGVKGKVVEALSRGLPLVTTSIGAQGIVGLDDVVPVHDDADGIVAALKRLLTDDDAWIAQSAAQMGFAQQFFSRSAMQRSVLSALESGEAVSVETDPA